MLDVFIGYDKAEPVAFHTCCESLISNSSQPLRITPVYRKQFEFKDPEHQAGYEPSNEFIFTRFAVPELAGYAGKALWLDGDMVVLGDVSELFQLSMAGLGVRVVKHDYMTRRRKKYLGATNENYPRKNWSSVILWNCGFFPHRQLRHGGLSGEFLHRFQWLSDDQIGDLPPEWNVLADEPNQAKNPKLIHYTLGTPCFKGFEGCEYADHWHKYHKDANDYRQN